MKVNHFHYKLECVQNPYIGFTSFQHFRNDALYSDLIVKPENCLTETEHVECYPIPDYVQQNGRTEGYYPDASVAYIRVLWKEFEPEQGEYRYDFMEKILQRAKENGQTLMFRLLPHSTRESDDVPSWLKMLIDCPARPQGARVKDSPSSPLFLEYFAKALRAIGERFDGDPAFAFLDVALPGAWGEGSSVDLFTEKQLTDFVLSYASAYKHVRLIGQMAPVWLEDRLSKQFPIGWRADCIGHPLLTYKYAKESADALSEIWKTGHVSFESYWWLGEWQRQGWDLDEIIQTTLDWHVSTFNAKSLPIPWEWKEKIDAWVAKMGYHFVIDSFACPILAHPLTPLTVTLTIDNVGVAPIYHEMPLYVRLKGEGGVYELDAGVDARAWSVGKNQTNITLHLPQEIGEGEYTVEVALGGKCHPKVYFATDAAQDGHYAQVGHITVTHQRNGMQ